MSEPHGEAMLRVTRVTKRYSLADGRSLTVLDRASVALRPGEVVAITGPSGSGKSTLLRLLGGLEAPDEGAATWHERPDTPIARWTHAERARWRRERVGFVFQDFRLVPTLTALENVALALELIGRPWPEAASEATALLEELGLRDRLAHRPSALSGGEQQRVAVARAFAHRPQLVLADEPTGNLDRKTSDRVMARLLGLAAARATALVLVTHDPEVAARAERSVRLRDGQVLASGAEAPRARLG